MRVEDFFFRRYGVRRRLNPDGTIKIACKLCGDIISNSNNMKIGTAICHACATGKPKLKQVPVIDGRPRPDLMEDMTQEELLRAIYEGERSPAPGSIEDIALRSKKEFSILNLALGAFRALAFVARQKPELDESKVKYEVADAQSSKAISKQKRRIPIFGKGSNKDEYTK